MTIVDLATRRQYSELKKRADEFIKTEGWEALLRRLKQVRPDGKARDAVVALLQLDAVGGSDSDVFKEFESLEGGNLRQVRANTVHHAMDVLREQIENKHTYFIDIDAMTMTPYVILVKEVIKARKRELEQLEGSPSRIDVLGTYYGFQILMTDGSKPHDSQSQYGYYRWRRRTWLDERISDSAANAVKKITGELADEVDMDKRYRTLGSSPVFKSRCTKATADILANAVRLALYKVPGNRSTAARALGRTGDSRVLPFLHHRLPLEQSTKVRISMAEAIGRVGHESSIEMLKELATPRGRYLSKEGEAMVEALGGIYSPRCKETLIELLKHDGNTTRAAVIQALSKQELPDLVGLISPYVVNSSRPVVRASVLALSELGSEGEAVIRAKAPIVIKRIGYDRPSKPALTRMLGISGVASMQEVHQYFAKRFERLGRELKRWQHQGSRGYSYYWRRRENRARERLIEHLRLASSHLKPPFDEDLVKSIRSILNMETGSDTFTAALRQSELAEAIKVKQYREAAWVQSFLSSFR
ncbi:MAG: HEAT repeat domain-containing protein [Candidatus Thorarchaeota archaeon SMTZ1-45]|nr:MAG: hypothetical protein AM325_10000 [Candidatus Thorarchaeota archaeon SMTZ1-45]